MDHKADRAESRIKLVVVLVLGAVTLFAGFSKTKEWTLHAVPENGTWYAWATACIPELLVIAAMLSIRQRRRWGITYKYPTALMAGAGLFTVLTQLGIHTPADKYVARIVAAVSLICMSKLIFADVEGRKQYDERKAAEARRDRAEATGRAEAEALRVAEMEALRDTLRATEAEKAEALRQAAEARAEATSAAEQLAEQRASVGATAAAVEALRVEHAAAVEALRTEHAEALRRAAEEKAEALRALRAKLTTVDLTERRRGAVTSTGGGKKPPAEAPSGIPAEAPSDSRARTDDECLRAMAETTTDPLHEWTPTAAQKAAGVGFERAKRLVKAWPQWASATYPQTTATAN